MSDKNVSPTESGFYDINGDMFVTVDKYEAEKQRADAHEKTISRLIYIKNEESKRADDLEKLLETSQAMVLQQEQRADDCQHEMRMAIRAGLRYKERADRLEKENQKLKEALASIAARHIETKKLKALTHEQALEVVQNDTIIAKEALK